jgi:hypothetical protein
MTRPFASIAAAAAMLALAGCDTPIAAVIGGSGPTVRGTVNDMTGAGVRVGLIGTPVAGGKAREIASTAADSGSFSLTFPGSPPLDLMQQPAEDRSIIFTLRAYQDRNGDQAYQDGEPLCDCTSGQFRYFSSDGPEGSYRAGWNAIVGGRFSQSFDTAYAL